MIPGRKILTSSFSDSRELYLEYLQAPFLLNATIAHHMETYRQEDPEFVTKFGRSIYVDDVIFGTGDDDNTQPMKIYH